MNDEEEDIPATIMKYQEQKSQGKSVDEAFLAVWDRLELTVDELQWILVMSATCLTEHEPEGSESDCVKAHEKLRSFFSHTEKPDSYIITKQFKKEGKQ